MVLPICIHFDFPCAWGGKWHSEQNSHKSQFKNVVPTYHPLRSKTPRSALCATLDTYYFRLYNLAEHVWEDSFFFPKGLKTYFCVFILYPI
jgi:hypothetical protein